jgi:serine/threonine protein kinase
MLSLVQTQSAGAYALPPLPPHMALVGEVHAAVAARVRAGARTASYHEPEIARAVDALLAYGRQVFEGQRPAYYRDLRNCCRGTFQPHWQSPALQRLAGAVAAYDGARLNHLSWTIAHIPLGPDARSMCLQEIMHMGANTLDPEIRRNAHWMAEKLVSGASVPPQVTTAAAPHSPRATGALPSSQPAVHRSTPAPMLPDLAPSATDPATGALQPPRIAGMRPHAPTTAAAPPPMTQKMAAVKAPKLPREVHAAINLPEGSHVRELHLENGEVLLYSETLRRGAVGRFKIGLRHSDGAPFAIKLQLTEASVDKPLQTTDGKLRTRPVLWADVEREVAIANVVKPEAAPLYCLDVAGTAWTVMPLFHSDVLAVARGVGPMYRKVIFRHLMRQAAQLLARDVHGKGLIHGDIKPDNLFVEAYLGQLFLGDFGCSQWLIDGKVDHKDGGALFAPEFVCGMPCDGRSDVWSLAVTFCDLHMLRSQTSSCSPFWLEDTADQPWEALWETLVEFQAWRATLLDDDGKVNFSRIEPGGRFGTYFMHVIIADKKVASFVLDHMLVFEVEDRATSAEVAEFFTAIARNQPHRDRAVKEVMAAIYNANVHGRTIGPLRQYWAWRAALPATPHSADAAKT